MLNRSWPVFGAAALLALSVGMADAGLKHRAAVLPKDRQIMVQVKALMAGVTPGTPLSQAVSKLASVGGQQDGGASAIAEARYFIAPDIMVDFALEQDGKTIASRPRVYRSPMHFN